MQKAQSKRAITPKWHRRKEARPGEIVAAALTLFVERGFAATRLEEVARLAGISKGTLYLYFESKQALFEAVIKEIIIPQVERSEAMVAKHQGTQAELLRSIVLNWWNHVSTTKASGIPKLVMAEAANFPEVARFFVDNVMKRVRRLLEAVIRAGIRQGEFREHDPEYSTRLLIAPMVYLAIWQHSLMPYDSDFELDQNTYMQLHLDTFIQGLKAN